MGFNSGFKGLTAYSRLIFNYGMCYSSEIEVYYSNEFGDAVAQLVEALRYKPEGRGFDSEWFYCIFN